jgi:hypothetical protein
LQLVSPTLVPLWSAWQSEFAVAPVHVRPVGYSEPLNVIDVYVPVSDAVNVFHAVHCVVAIWLVVNCCEKLVFATHLPPLHVGVCTGQTFPHIPQLLSSLDTSVHDPPQYSVPSEQQLPALHHCEDVHAVAQLPQ